MKRNNEFIIGFLVRNRADRQVDGWLVGGLLVSGSYPLDDHLLYTW